MKKYLVIIFTLFIIVSFSQEKENYKVVVSKFKTFYNNANYDGIFSLINEETKKTLTLERTNNFFNNNVSPLGKINKLEFSKIEKGFHIYKMNFDKGIFDLFILLDTNNTILGYAIKPFNFSKLERNNTKMILPFNEEWTVGWGGVTEKQNYHVAYDNQKYAYDLYITKKGVTHKKGKTNDCYYVFGKKLIAVCDAKVVKVIRGVYDNVPGEKNPKQLTGNTIVLKTDNKEFILYAHFKENSIVVNEGQNVKQGDLLGQCGNSGNSTEPHLHLSLQNAENMINASGGKLFFERINVNGKIKEDYIPVKNEKIKNTK